MSAKLLFSFRHWSMGFLGKLAEETNAGCILGDPFCQVRMFGQGEWGLITAAKAARALGLTIAVQTPVYLTPRNFMATTRLIFYLLEQELAEMIYLQDIGLLRYIKDADVQKVWTVWGWNRGENVTSDLLELLGELGITHLETDKYSRVASITSSGLQAVYRRYSPTIVSFGRFCNIQAYLNQTCSGQLCAHGQRKLLATVGQQELSVTGYALEHPTSTMRPPASGAQFIGVYLDNVDEYYRVLPCLKNA